MSIHDKLSPVDETTETRREQVEIARALAVFGDWLQTAQLPVVEQLRSLLEPQIVVMGGEPSDIGPKLAAVLQTNATVEQTPHGCQVDDGHLMPKGETDSKKYVQAQLEAAFVRPPDLLVLPYTLDHGADAAMNSLTLASKTVLQEPLHRLHTSRTETRLALILSKNTEYEELFTALGLHKVHEVSLAPSGTAPETAGHLAMFVSGETIVTAENVALIREADCVLTGIVSGVFGVGDSLSACVDEIGIKTQDHLFDLTDQMVTLDALHKRVAARLKRLSAALPQFMSHTDERMQRLGESFQVTEAAFTVLLGHLHTVEQISKNLIMAFDQGRTSPEIRAQIVILQGFQQTVEAWYDTFRSNTTAVAKNPAYQAYRVLTNEVDRRE